jgi:hypothetical protein
MITADQVGSTIAFLAPGFLALKIFYLFALKSKRSDLEWTIWSLIASLALSATAGRFTSSQPAAVAISFAFAALVGVIASWAWIRTSQRWPRLRQMAQPMAWDSMIPSKQWLQVVLVDGRVVSGQPAVVADSAESGQLDLWLTYPAWVVNGESQEMPNVQGVWIPAEQIRLIQSLPWMRERRRQSRGPSPRLYGLIGARESDRD